MKAEKQQTNQGGSNGDDKKKESEQDIASPKTEPLFHHAKSTYYSPSANLQRDRDSVYAVVKRKLLKTVIHTWDTEFKRDHKSASWPTCRTLCVAGNEHCTSV